METFATPQGAAGSDQLWAMEESIQGQLEQMFWQEAKTNSLRLGVGRTIITGDGVEMKIRLDAQKRECDGDIVFHAGRALELALSRLMDGAEVTIHHPASPSDLILRVATPTKFENMPETTFEEFLEKADAASYGRDMRWAHYNARDHEYGRPYVTIGTLFFAHLVKGIIDLCHAHWTWDEGFTRRWHTYRQRNIRNSMQLHAMQNFSEKVELPEMVPVDDAMKLWREPPKSLSSAKGRGYEHLHRRIEV